MPVARPEALQRFGVARSAAQVLVEPPGATRVARVTLDRGGRGIYVERNPAATERNVRVRKALRVS